MDKGGVGGREVDAAGDDDGVKEVKVYWGTSSSGSTSETPG